MKAKKHKTQVLEFGTPTQAFRLMITRSDGRQKCYKNAVSVGDLMELFDLAVEDADQDCKKDGVMRTVSIEQVILQKNIFVN